MYAYLRKQSKPSVNTNAILAFVISLTALSLMDVMFNMLSLAKGSFFTLMWLFFIGVFAMASLQLVKRIHFESRYFKYLFYIFMVYGLVNVIRGFSLVQADLTSFLRVPYIFWPFLIPFFAFFGQRLHSFKFLLNYLFYLGFVYILIIVLFPSMLLSPAPVEMLGYSLVLGPGFLLMNSNLFSSIKVNLSFVFITIATLSFIYLARRAGLFVMLAILASSYAVVLFKNQKPLLFKLFPLFIVAGAILFFQFDGLGDSLLENINKRIFEDTRSTVVNQFYIDMNGNEIFGKGMNGKYYCPIGGGLTEEGLDYEIIYYRDIIENGYLQLMLSGGIVHIVLFLLIMLPAAYNGIFRSSNQLTKSCGAMILLWLVFMIGSGLPSLSLGYILTWISVGVCYRKSIRIKTDEEIKEAFVFKNLKGVSIEKKTKIGANNVATFDSSENVIAADKLYKKVSEFKK